MLTVLIADADMDFAKDLSEEINLSPHYRVAAAISDGKAALEHIEKLEPDIVILDVIMPEADAIYIVNHIRSNMIGYDPMVYVLSSMGTYGILNALSALSIDFFSMKPVSVDVIMHNLDFIARREDGRRVPAHPVATVPQDDEGLTEIDRKVRTLERDLGLRPFQKSFEYIREALVYCIENPDGTHLITKRLYPSIAKRHMASVASVERSIRHGIYKVQKSHTMKYCRIFSYRESDRRITNSEFLSILAEHIRNDSRTTAR